MCGINLESIEMAKEFIEQHQNQNIDVKVLRKSIFGGDETVQLSFVPSIWSDGSNLTGFALKSQPIF